MMGFRAAPAQQQQLESRRVASTRDHATVNAIVAENDAIAAAQVLALPSGSRQALPPVAPAEAVRCSPEPEAPPPPRFEATEVCIAHVDTLTAALALGDDTCALSFANAETPGGRYRSGGLAQEEDLCRLLPQLYPSLAGSGAYPIEAGTALLSRGLLAVRRAPHPAPHKPRAP